MTIKSLFNGPARDLSATVVLITGAARGLGFEYARSLGVPEVSIHPVIGRHPVVSGCPGSLVRSPRSVGGARPIDRRT